MSVGPVVAAILREHFRKALKLGPVKGLAKINAVTVPASFFDDSITEAKSMGLAIPALPTGPPPVAVGALPWDGSFLKQIEQVIEDFLASPIGQILEKLILQWLSGLI